MVEKKEGKENEKCSTMPDVLIKGYKILRTVSVGQDFGVDPKSTYSTTFGVDPKFTRVCAANPHK